MGFYKWLWGLALYYIFAKSTQRGRNELPIAITATFDFDLSLAFSLLRRENFTVSRLRNLSSGLEVNVVDSQLRGSGFDSCYHSALEKHIQKWPENSYNSMISEEISDQWCKNQLQITLQTTTLWPLVL